MPFSSGIGGHLDRLQQFLCALRADLRFRPKPTHSGDTTQLPPPSLFQIPNPIDLLGLGPPVIHTFQHIAPFRQKKRRALQHSYTHALPPRYIHPKPTQDVLEGTLEVPFQPPFPSPRPTNAVKSIPFTFISTFTVSPQQARTSILHNCATHWAWGPLLSIQPCIIACSIHHRAMTRSPIHYHRQSLM